MCLDNSYIVCKLDVCVCARAQLNPNFMFGNPSATKKLFNYFILFYLHSLCCLCVALQTEAGCEHSEKIQTKPQCQPFQLMGQPPGFLLFAIN